MCMVTLTLKNIPETLYDKLKQNAAQNRRSLNSEILVCLEQAVATPKLKRTEVLERVRTLRQKTVNHLLTQTELLEAKNEGRL
jgi:antitoxin FitA